MSFKDKAIQLVLIVIAAILLSYIIFTFKAV